jgi:hypothetical protein
MALGIVIGYSLSGKQNTSSKVNDIIEVIHKNYVDKVDGEKLFEETISEMLHKLDPHSNYISPQEMKALNEQIQGEFGGIGVRFTLLRDTICVTNVIPGSPSDFAGVLAGDKIIEISKKYVVLCHQVFFIIVLSLHQIFGTALRKKSSFVCLPLLILRYLKKLASNIMYIYIYYPH